MLSHDNLTWNVVAVNSQNAKDLPESAGSGARIVSYLPLSHIAGFSFDVLGHMTNVCEVYFARPDAL